MYICYKIPSLGSKGRVKSKLQTLGDLVLDGNLSSKGIVSVPLLSEGQA
jgi:hypothetical protein